MDNEARRLVTLAAETEYQRIGSAIASARETLKLSRKRVASLAGISEKTLINLEKGLLKSCSWDTLNRLRMILNISLYPNHDIINPSLARRTITLSDFSSSEVIINARNTLYGEIPRLNYCDLRSTVHSIDAYQLANSSQQYNVLQTSGMHSLCQIVRNIPNFLRLYKLEVICLTIGHGWHEVVLVNFLLQSDEHLTIDLCLVSENEYLLSIGEKAVIDHVPDQYRNRLRVSLVVGDHGSFVCALNSHNHRPWQRIFCLFGTMINIENGSLLVENLCHQMRPGDLLAFDINIAAHPTRIYEDDARLCEGRLPRGFVAAVEQSLQVSLESLQLPSRPFRVVGWEYGLDDPYHVYDDSLQSYSIHVNATIYEDNIGPQKISCMRIHRHDPERLIHLLNRHRMRLVDSSCFGKNLEFDYKSSNLLFMRY